MKHEHCPIIYIVTNTVNGKQYVGQTRRGIKERWRKHVRRAMMQKWECAAIAAAIRKYGESVFTIVQTRLSPDATQAEIDEAEKQTIIRLNSMSPNGYNLIEGGKGGRPSEETKAKISSRFKGKPLSLEHRAKLSAAQKSRKRTSPAEQDGYRRQAEKLRGIPRPPEVIAKCVATKKGRPPTEKQKAAAIRHSEFMTGREQSEESNARRSAALKAYYATHQRSAETCRKLSESQKGRVFSEETRAKMREARRRYLDAVV